MLRAALLVLALISVVAADIVYRAEEPVESATYIESDGGSFLIEFALPALVVESDPTAEFAMASDFSIPGGGKLAIEGTPDLPVIRRMVRIPETGGLTLEIVEEVTASLGLYSVAPFTGYPLRSGEQPDYRIDQQLYSTSEFYPSSPVTIESIGILRDLRIAWVTFNPVRINPVTGETLVTTSITARFISEGPGENELLRNVTSYTRSFLPIYREVLGFDENDLDAGDGCYLVITSAEGYSYARDLVNWKREKGWEVEIGLVPTIGSSAAAIDAWIENAFNTWDTPPEWILIVGDEDVVPPPYASGTAADNQYGVIGSGVNPSIHVGRLTGGDTDVLGYMAWKIENYEKDPYQPASSWFQHAVSIGSTDFQDPWMSYRYAALMMASGMDTDLYCNSSSYGGTPPSVSNISAEVNSGTSLLSYIGHGSITSWVTTGFNNGNVNALSNGRLLPWISSIACNNAEFQGSTLCFGEAWMSYGSIASPKGAVGFMGATMGSPVGPTDSLALYQFKGYFELDMYHMGAAFDYGKIKAYEYTSSESNSNMHMIMGCPEFDIFTETSPLVYLDADHPAVIYPGPWGVTVTLGGAPVEGALVGVVQDTTLLARGYTDGSGIASLDVDALVSSNDATITVTVHNGYPYRGTAVVSTGIEEGSGPLQRFQIMAPAPNPFSASASFTYSLATAGQASLEIYDVSGRIVRTLTSGEHEAGTHSVEWLGDDHTGTAVPNGIYVGRLTSADGTLTTTCILLR